MNLFMPVNNAGEEGQHCKSGVSNVKFFIVLEFASSETHPSKYEALPCPKCCFSPLRLERLTLLLKLGISVRAFETC